MNSPIKKHQAGFTMIELLVAVLILAIGLLGVAGIQTFSVKASSNSNLRGTALYLANNMLDRMRANPGGVSGGNYNSMTGKAQTAACLTSTGCSVSQMANNDKYEWEEAVKDALPDGVADIALAGGVFTISVSWTERVKQGEIANDDAGTDTSTLNLRTQL
ncbi:type IV pilus modification protein PilV [Hahella sp. CCB-MM4]|uniref:type IV pilus modification protein PilV n=1 Tax=Hahella sp. (strain CCB-MM4) TaxID=1926491 RepID=UPI000B9BBBDB|nr:type IV pilus modification protein PilV [Hahella sp. CCB-MM4]OZG71474.1 type IV pilus modification protein PilV [Hahella sp. CCB-MM4]